MHDIRVRQVYYKIGSNKFSLNSKSDLVMDLFDIIMFMWCLETIWAILCSSDFSLYMCKSNYRSELSIVPCSIIISPLNFQKKSEILKMSFNNPTPKF